jgi:hypothetical protein
MFNVNVELLDPAEFEIPILGLQGARKSGRVRRRYKLLKQEGARKAARLSGIPIGAIREREGRIRFSEVRRVLPQSLRALVPGRVVKNRVPCADSSVLASERLPGDSDAWLQRGHVHINPNSAIRLNANVTSAKSQSGPSDKELSTRKIEISLPVLRFFHWSG